MVAFERLGERVLVDDFAARDIDQHASRLHPRETALVEQPVRLGRPLAADHDEVALRQKAVEIRGAAHFAAPRRQGVVRLRVAPGADDPHADRSAEPADVAPYPAGADDAGGLAFDQKRPVGAVLESAGAAIGNGAVEALGEVQYAGQRIFRHRQRAADAARCGYDDITAPEIAA